MIHSIFISSLPNLLRASEIIQRPDSHQNWIIGTLLIVFIAIAYIQTVYSKRISLLFDALVSNRFVRQLVREEQAFTSRVTILFSLISVISIALFLVLSMSVIDVALGDRSGFVLFLIVSLLVILFYALKIILLGSIGFLIRFEQELTEYIYNLFLFNHVLGLLLLPVSIAIAFLPLADKTPLVFLGFALIASFFLFRLIKLYLLGNSVTYFSRFYIILYLCTLEFLPAVYAFGLQMK